VRNGGSEAEKELVPKWEHSGNPDSIAEIIDASMIRSLFWSVARKMIEGMPISDEEKVGALLDYLDGHDDETDRFDDCFAKMDDKRLEGRAGICG
jgi:hypothetical protein